MSNTNVSPEDLACAKRNFQQMIQMLNNMEWKFQVNEEEMIIQTAAVGDDLQIPLHIVCSAERKVMYIKSKMPFKVDVAKYALFNEATTIANYSMLDGCFEYDGEETIGFKIVVPFYGGSVLTEEVCRYMVILTCQMVDKFNDKFFALNNGEMSMSAFKKFVDEE